MQNGSQYGFAIEPNRAAHFTNVTLEISAQAVFDNLKKFDFPNYVVACHRNLYRVAARESIEILVWSVDPDFEHQSIFHRVCMRGVLTGMLPMLIVRALRPPPGYSTLDFLTRAIEKDWRVKGILKTSVEQQRLQRHDHAGKRLQSPLPEQLLARALAESDWPLLISPSDRPWAYINTATQRIYQRQYEERCQSEKDVRKIDPKPSRAPSPKRPTGDELQLDNTPDSWRAAGLTDELMAVLRARAEGKKWRELPVYLSNQTGEHFDGRRVEAARGKLRRLNSAMRATALAASQWKPRRTRATVYRQRVPDGGPWNGSWTYAHRYEGEELEALGDLERHRWAQLFRKN